MTGEPEGLTAVLLQLAGITQKLAELDQRQASDTRELKERITALAALVNELKDTTASHAETLAALDGLDRQVADWPPRPPATLRDGDGEPAGYQPPAAPKFWKPDGPAREQADRQAAGVGRAGVPARLRAPGGQPRRLLGPAPAVPVHPGLAVRAVVGALPGPGAAPRARWPGRPNGTPGCCPPRPSSSPARPAAAPTAPPATARPPGQGRSHDRPAHRRAGAGLRRGTAGRCSPASPAASSPPPGTASTTPPPTRTRSPGGGGASPTANLAIATGQPGPDVLDVDQHGPAGNGFAALQPAQARRARSTAPARSSPPPAAGCTPTSPAAASTAASCPATTWTSAPRAATSSPRPPRSAASPTRSSATGTSPAAWTGPRSPALLEPAAPRRPPGPPGLSAAT